MKYFLDSAKVDEIAYALEMWNIDGVTTNPRHIQASGKPFLKVLREIGSLFAGSGKPVSVEVNPHHCRWQDMAAEAEELVKISPNFVIKLPAVEDGFRAVLELEKRDIRTNLTLVFSPTQALNAMRMGATFISPFIGWKEANGEGVWTFIDEIVAIRDRYGYESQIIVAAVRNGRQIVESALTGADIVTAGMEVYKESFEHPYTHEGLAKFQGFWDKTPYE